MSENIFAKRFNNLKRDTEDLSNYTLEELENLLFIANSVHDEYENLQLIVKRNANSLYGTSASKFFSLHDTDLAEDITTTGKHYAILIDIAINKFFESWATDENLAIIKEFYPTAVKLINFDTYKPDTEQDLCIYGDTDSRYVRNDMIYNFILFEDGKKSVTEISHKELADFADFLDNKFIREVIKRTIDEDCEYRNARKGFLKMAHEVTTRKSVFLKKKKYIMSPVWADGKTFEKPKLKFKGIELKRGSMSEKAKKILSKFVDKFIIENYSVEQLRKDCLKIISYIKMKKDKELIYQITSVSGLSDIKKENNRFVSDKTHIQIQLALSWLNFIQENNYQELYKPAFEGQKMSYYYCDEKSGYKVIGIPDDVDINSVQNLPEPDWNRMIIQTIIKPLCRYILDKQDITDKDVESFLLGVKTWNF